MAELFTFTVRDSATIRDSILRVLRSGLIARGVANPNVTPGSDWYVLAQATANQLAVVEANAVLKADEMMPDTATAEALERIAAIFGISKQAAAGSLGTVVLEASASTSVATGTELVDGAGLIYEVSTGGIYADGASIPIAAVSTGSATNHAEGDTLRWVTPPPFADAKALVGPGGLVNGVDAENDEALRARLFALLQNAPGSGNPEHVAEIAEAASPSVQKAFIYPACSGPSSAHVALTAAPTATSKSRELLAALLTGTIVPYIEGHTPTHSLTVATTVADVNADVAFGLSLPESPTANPPGAGGGWLNGSPWPAPDASTTWRCTVTGVTSTTQFTVDATTAPQENISRIAWLSPYDWQLYRALVIDVSGTSGAYVITLDQPFVDITTGSYIWPDCENAQAYVNAVLAQFALMGPGEKTSNASALIRGFRHPRTAAGWPTSLGPHLARAISNAQTEVESVQFFYRTDGTTTLTDSSGVVLPQVPATVTDPPNIFVPRHIAFYRIP
jgi:hypothetical protein